MARRRGANQRWWWCSESKVDPTEMGMGLVLMTRKRRGRGGGSGGQPVVPFWEQGRVSSDGLMGVSDQLWSTWTWRRSHGCDSLWWRWQTHISGMRWCWVSLFIYLFLVSEIRSLNLGISEYVAHFNSWSIEWYREFETEDFDSVLRRLLEGNYAGKDKTAGCVFHQVAVKYSSISLTTRY